jgi:hypothetical protein
MGKTFSKVICILIGILLISMIMPVTLGEYDDDSESSRELNGIKGVSEKVKPEGNPGGGKPDKPPKPGDDEPTVDKWAVVIGIADYQGIGNDLRYTDDDAVDMYDYLVSVGYPTGNIKLLLNKKATARNILRAIDWMDGKETKETSECVFFYSGHGSTYDGYDDGDTEYRDETIVSSDLYVILDGQLRSKFSTFSSKKLSFIFDSCYSGGMDDLTASGRVIVTACGETELSYDGSATMQNGVFSFYYISGLYTYDTIEGAFSYGATLASGYMDDNYDIIMTPQLYDQYSGSWTF